MNKHNSYDVSIETIESYTVNSAVTLTRIVYKATDT